MPDKVHLLIVTKEEDMGILLSRLATKKGLIPYHVDNETEAISIIQQVDPPITLLDFDARSEKDFKTLNALKTANPKSSVIVLTQAFSPITRERALKAGAEYCLSDPLDTKVLYSFMDKVLTQKRFRETSSYHLPGEAGGERPFSPTPGPITERGPRIPCRILVKYQPLSLWDINLPFEGKEAVANNVSLGGTELETDLMHKDTRSLALRFYSSLNEEEWIDSFGRIIWKRKATDSESYRVGLEFFGLDNGKRRKVLHYATYAQPYFNKEQA